MEEERGRPPKSAASTRRQLLNRLSSCCRSSLGNRSIDPSAFPCKVHIGRASLVPCIFAEADTAFLFLAMAKQPANGVVNAGEFWEEWSRCITFKYQRDQLYRMGNFDDCGKEWKDYSNVLSVKFTNDPEKASRVLEATHLYQSRTTSPTVGVIWETKGTPSWD
jgi:hypothetical protein